MDNKIKSINDMIKTKRGQFTITKGNTIEYRFISRNIINVDGRKHYAVTIGFTRGSHNIVVDYISKNKSFADKDILGIGGFNPKTKKYNVMIIKEFNSIKNLKFISAGLNKKIQNRVKKLGSLTEAIDTTALAVAQALVSVFTLLFIFFYFFKVLKVKTAEWEVERLEKEMSEGMFKGQDKNDSAFNAYLGLINSIEGMINSDNRFGLLIYGPPGTGKTYVVRRTLYFNKTKYVFKKGSTGNDVASGLMRIFFENKNDLIVLDDFDDALIEPGARNILKAVTDTYPKRIISVPRAETTGQYDVANVPEEFVFKGKVIVITNLSEKEIEPAILSRMNAQEVRFTNEEMVKLLEKMIHILSPDIPENVKREVINHLREIKNKHPHYKIDFRTFKTALDLRIMYPENWKQIFAKTIR